MARSRIMRDRHLNKLAIKPARALDKRAVLLVLFLSFVLGISFSCFSVVVPPDFRTDQILIKPKVGLTTGALENFLSTQNARTLQTFGTLKVQVVSVPDGATVENFISKLNSSGLVEFAEPDYIIHAAATIPNDPYFLDGSLWGLNNYGQNGGTPDADIDAPEAWDVISSASNVVVAILDTGVRYTHEDLANNMWVNPLDGGHGFNAFTKTNDPNDDQGHGTLMAGIIGAEGNNEKGVTGVAWHIQMMACKCLDNTGNGSDSTLIATIEYAQTNGAKIINASLDSSGFSMAVSNAISSARDAGIIFVASCGNNSSDVDSYPRYPACYGIDNIVSVAYTTRNDLLGMFSNFGRTNVNLAAPGDQIFSTFAAADDSYFPIGTSINLAGTSFAAAYVSGALALLEEKFPSENYRQIIERLLRTTDRLANLQGKCVTGGRLNLFKALCPPIELIPLAQADEEPFQFSVVAGPNRTCVVESSPDLLQWTPIYTNSTSTNWSFDFEDVQSTNSPQRFYRAVRHRN
jgi:subtilisin family serine protease